MYNFTAASKGVKPLLTTADKKNPFLKFIKNLDNLDGILVPNQQTSNFFSATPVQQANDQATKPLTGFISIDAKNTENP